MISSPLPSPFSAMHSLLQLPKKYCLGFDLSCTILLFWNKWNLISRDIFKQMKKNHPQKPIFFSFLNIRNEWGKEQMNATHSFIARDELKPAHKVKFLKSLGQFVFGKAMFVERCLPCCCAR